MGEHTLRRHGEPDTGQPMDKPGRAAARPWTKPQTPWHGSLMDGGLTGRQRQGMTGDRVSGTAPDTCLLYIITIMGLITPKRHGCVPALTASPAPLPKTAFQTPASPCHGPDCEQAMNKTARGWPQGWSGLHTVSLCPPWDRTTLSMGEIARPFPPFHPAHPDAGHDAGQRMSPRSAARTAARQALGRAPAPPQTGLIVGRPSRLFASNIYHNYLI